MNPSTKTKLKKICFILDLKEEEGIAFCINATFKDSFGLIHHSKKMIEEESQIRDVSTALISSPSTLKKEEKEAIKNLLNNIENIQTERDQDAWCPNPLYEGEGGL